MNANTPKPATRLLLKYLALSGTLVILSLANPQLPYFLARAYFKSKKFQRRKFRQDLKRLQTRELIDYQELPDGKTKIILKSAGKKLTLKYDIDDIKIQKPKAWDGKWRMIIFDIPDKKRAASNAINLKLKELGFYKLQKSVFILPFPCENEIEFITSIFDVRDHILIMNIGNFEGDIDLKRHFNI